MNLFYSEITADGRFVLGQDESKHCIRALRKKVGEHIEITDGKGHIFCSLIERIEGGLVHAAAESVREIPMNRNYRLHIAIAPTKNPERFEWFLEKATEIGIDRITPLICDRSEKQNLKRERAERILVSAMKQSLNAWLPELESPAAFKEFIARDLTGQKFIPHCETGEKQEIHQAVVRGENVILLVGPEGDFTREEIEAAIMLGFSPVSFGENRLRTETAGLYAVTAISLLNKI
jgi:16S rRNA (uracil1498-N3)-methyltransferase